MEREPEVGLGPRHPFTVQPVGTVKKQTCSPMKMALDVSTLSRRYRTLITMASGVGKVRDRETRLFFLFISIDYLFGMRNSVCD